MCCALTNASITLAQTATEQEAETLEASAAPPVAAMQIPGVIQGFIPVFPQAFPQPETPRPQVPVSYSPSFLRTKTGQALHDGRSYMVAPPMAMPPAMPPMPMPMFAPPGAMYPGMPPVYPPSGVMQASAMAPVMQASAQRCATAPGGCDGCGGRGCRQCKILDWLSCLKLPRLGGLGLLGRHGFGLGSNDASCCAQRWFDVHAEAMFLSRDIGRNADFTSSGLGVPANIVLSTDNLNFDPVQDGGGEEGFRITTAMQLGSGTSLEMGYYGSFNWADAAEACDPDGQLFSALSDFGFDPFNGFDDTDRSFLQRIEYSSSFDNFDLSFRRRWVGPNCRFQGSWTLGARYFYLDEGFRYMTRGDNETAATALADKQARIAQADALGQLRFMDYGINTRNSLTGCQVGADLWACALPGLSIGAEGKCGIYGNTAKQTTHVSGNSIADFTESKVANEVAFILQGDLMLVYKLNYSWTLRAGYHMLFVDGVALASENFNSVPPIVFSPPPGNDRVTSINSNGNVFYHGGTVGLEWMW